MSDLIEKLEYSVAAGRARHAYLLAGTDTAKTDATAKALASLLLFGSRNTARLFDEPDYTELDGSISIAQFRDEIQPEIYRETYGKSCRVVYFKSSHLLSQMVQNAMLKVLEEPPAGTYFILTGNEHGILPTIRSRCTVVRCPGSSAREIAEALISRGASREDAERYAAMSGHDTGRALRLCRDEQYRAMRAELYPAFIASLSGTPDFKYSRKKRERNDWSESAELLLLFAHDMLASACGFEPEYCKDFASEIKKLSLHFTIGEIGCIIDKITEAAMRTATNAGGGAVFDRLFAEAAEVSLKAAARAKRAESVK